jgi:hypothetical protein
MRLQDLALRLLGATSGEQIVRAAAAASGAITLPAGTTDFSATGGASQVIRQSTAGGPFTVGQLAASDVTGALAGNQTITLGGDLSGSGTTSITATLVANSVVTTDITNANVTYAKIQNVAASRVLGNPTGSPAAPSEISLGTGLAFAGTVLNGAVGTLTGVTAGTGLTGGGTSGNPTISLTTPVAVANGGTGLSAGTSGGVPYYSATGTIASSALLTANALVKGGGAGVAPVASTATVDGSGNLTTAGGLRVNNNATAILTSDGANVQLYSPDGAAGQGCIMLGSSASPANYARNTGHYIQNRAGSVTFAQFDATQNILGPTKIYKASVGDPLYVQTDSGLYCRTYYQGTRSWTAGVDGPAGGYLIADETAGAIRMQISTTGACTNTTGTWSAISDRRLKQDIAPYERGLAAVLELNPVRFRFNGRGVSDDGVLHYGLMADEVEAVVPEVVGETDLAAGPDSESMLVKTVDPGRLTYALINAVKELTARVVALEVALEARSAARG